MLRMIMVIFVGACIFGSGFTLGQIKAHREMAQMVPTSVALKGIHDVEQTSIAQIKSLEKTCLDAIDRVRKAQ